MFWRCCQSDANSSPVGAGRLKSLMSGGKALPFVQCGRAGGLVCLAVDQVALGLKVVRVPSVNGGEFLQRLHLAEAQHCSLSSSNGKMAVLGPVVERSTNVAAVFNAEFAHRSGLGR